MTVLDRYVSREFLMTFGFVLLAFLCLYMLVDFFERIRMFLSNSATPGQIVAYHLYTVPSIVAMMMPACVLLATLITFGLLSRNQEIVAMKANGISLYRAALPVVAFSIAACALNFLLNEFVTPASNGGRRNTSNMWRCRRRRNGGLSSRTRSGTRARAPSTTSNCFPLPKTRSGASRSTISMRGSPYARGLTPVRRCGRASAGSFGMSCARPSTAGISPPSSALQRSPSKTSKNRKTCTWCRKARTRWVSGSCGTMSGNSGGRATMPPVTKRTCRARSPSSS
ncbi:MAG: LptF/LptG family permease [Syntrophaceae bacterium]|nr:LptF/LptG family permease [Syntrophaceae bacterium]